jgi:uncharacterized protein DUF3465
MNKFLAVVPLLAAALAGCGHGAAAGAPATAADTGNAGDSLFAAAFSGRAHGLSVQGAGVVARVLPDDEQGSRHQRFIVRLASGQTLLIAHNIDIAPRLEGLREGDTLSFSGIYEWDARGGVVHWTHRDPDGHHPTGWIRYAGNTYQ